MFLMLCLTLLLPSPGDAQDVFTSLENRLLNAAHARFEVEITATGAVVAAYKGTFRMDDKGLFLKQDGHFMKAESHLHMAADGDTMAYGHKQQPKKVDEPTALAEAMWVGVMRMGLLHNLAMLHAGQGPDHAEGGVKDWVRVYNFQVLEDSRFLDREMQRIKFDIEVSKIPVGYATLWLDKETGLPCLREQVVRFPEGEMVVRETYRSFIIKDGATKP